MQTFLSIYLSMTSSSHTLSMQPQGQEPHELHTAGWDERGQGKQNRVLNVSISSKQKQLSAFLFPIFG